MEGLERLAGVGQIDRRRPHSMRLAGGVHANPVVAERQVRNLGRAGRHVALHATVLRALALPFFRSDGALSLLVALQANGPIVGDALAWLGKTMRVVAGGTREAARVLITLALVQLLDVPH